MLPLPPACALQNSLVLETMTSRIRIGLKGKASLGEWALVRPIAPLLLL